MKRKICTPREDWQGRVQSIGLTFHTDPTGPYWDESVYYEFSMQEVQAIETATAELYQMALKAVERVVGDRELLKLFCITDEWCDYVAASWQGADPNIYGRFDFSFEDGIPKLLEFNADTPTCLVEASVAQWFWFQDKFGEGPEGEKYDQFNSLHQNLIDQWKSIVQRLVSSASSFLPSLSTSTSHSSTPTLPPSASYPSPSHSPSNSDLSPSPSPQTFKSQSLSLHASPSSHSSSTQSHTPPPIKFHFSCVRDHEEDFRTINYLMEVAHQAGIEGSTLAISDIGWNAEKSCFVDLKEEPITHLFKLYPWEWIAREPFAAQLLNEKHNMRVIEPAWKMILSNKNILPILWEMFPNHPNLLACYFENNLDKLGGRFVKKPVLGREGNNVSIVMGEEGVKWKTEGEYGNESFIYQQVCLIPDFDGYRPLVGSWIIGNKPSGIGIREDNGPITQDASRFVPHVYTL